MSCSTYVLSICAIGLSWAALTIDALARGDGETVEIIKPMEQTSSIRAAAIDTERFEVGPYAGFVSVEDFGTDSIAGLSLGYHVSSQFLAQLNYAQSSVARAAFEDVVDGDFLAEEDRKFSYQSLLAGYELMHGRSFLGRQRKFNSHIYAIAGVGRVSFAGQVNAAAVVGINYKTVVTDWLVVNLDFRDIIFDREFLYSSKTTHNTEVTLNVSAMF